MYSNINVKLLFYDLNNDCKQTGFLYSCFETNCLKEPIRCDKSYVRLVEEGSVTISIL